MSNLNKVFLMGRMTRDPELRYTPQGTAVTELGMAVNREFNFVVVSLGSKDGIQAGSQFSVLRKGRAVGTVEVERIYENMAAANVLQEEKKSAIQEGDIVRLTS